MVPEVGSFQAIQGFDEQNGYNLKRSKKLPRPEGSNRKLNRNLNARFSPLAAGSALSATPQKLQAVATPVLGQQNDSYRTPERPSQLADSPQHNCRTPLHPIAAAPLNFEAFATPPKNSVSAAAAAAAAFPIPQAFDTPPRVARAAEVNSPEVMEMLAASNADSSFEGSFYMSLSESERKSMAEDSEEEDFIKRPAQNHEYQPRRQVSSKDKFKALPTPSITPLQGDLYRFKMNGQEFMVKLVGSGNSHETYIFQESKVVTVGNQTFNVKNKALKFAKVLFAQNLNTQRDYEAALNVLNSDVKAYDQVKGENFIPHVYVHPSFFKDTVPGSKNGNFWIVDGMKEKVDCSPWSNGSPHFALNLKSKAILDFVRNILTRSIKEEREVVNDFFPRNVMWSFDDKLYDVDSDMRENGHEVIYNVWLSILEWSNGNIHVFKYLIQGFPEAIQIKYNKDLLALQKRLGLQRFPFPHEIK